MAAITIPVPHGDLLQVSDNQRFLQHQDGRPFFYLGDTAWELFHRLDREETEFYLETRAMQGFTVIQAVILAEIDGLNTPNAYGDRPLFDNDADKPNEAYFKHVDWVVQRAAEHGIWMGLLPTWGSHMLAGTLANPDKAYRYGLFLGRRYADMPVIWILGGDRPPQGYEDAWQAMAKGITEGDGGRGLISYHPNGEAHSSTVLHHETWLDFNMVQSGHGRALNPNYERIEHDYALTPVKPCMDAEPRYEDHPINWNPQNGWFDDWDTREAAYWALFAGAHGHTYGCQDIWQMWQPGRAPMGYARTHWKEGIGLPGAWDMQHVRSLIASRPFFTRIPDQSLIAQGQAEGFRHIQATRDEDGTYAFIYLPMGGTVGVQTEMLQQPLKAWWFDPRTGLAQHIGERAGGGIEEFTAPSEGRGHDWVLVLDAVSAGYDAPGIQK